MESIERNDKKIIEAILRKEPRIKLANDRNQAEYDTIIKLMESVRDELETADEKRARVLRGQLERLEAARRGLADLAE